MTTTKLGFKTKGGFKSFVRRRDGKTPVPEVSLRQGPKTTGVKLEPLRRVLSGDNQSLVHAFSWSSAPQGSTHWVERNLGRQPLSPEDYQWLQELYDYHAQQQQD